MKPSRPRLSTRPVGGAVPRAARRSLPAAVLSAVLAVAAAPVAAQTGPSLQELAIDWALGRFGSPLICQIEGTPVRGMRRLQVVNGPRQLRSPLARIIFVSMEVEAATRCFTETEKSAPNISGTLEIRFPGAARRDTAHREFKTLLRREGGVEFDISGGVLRLQEVGVATNAARDVDFRGGKARFGLVRPGTDVERLLSAIKSPRKLDLVITARDGTLVKLPLFLVETR